MSIIAEMSNEVAEFLEPNLQFYRQGPSDKNRYYVGPEVLQGLGWIATTIALPLLLVGLSEAVKTYVKQWMEKSPDEKEASAQPGALPTEVSVEIERLLAGPTPLLSEDAQTQAAVEEVANFLSRRGWPKVIAAADAEAIVYAIKRRLE
jgi:hypothetical protein